MYYQQREEYDAIVVGSGISGGWAAKELCEKGLKTLVLDRGAPLTHGADYITEHKQTWEFPYGRTEVPEEEALRDFHIQSRTGQFDQTTKHFFLNDTENPYIEDTPFTWIRGGRVGGRSLIWGRQVYRWSDLDFEANLRDGHGVDWPIRYADIAPWYDYVERFIGVSGQAEGLPHLPDGQFLKPMEMNAAEKHFKAEVEAAFPERRVTIGRVAILTEPHNGRAACHYCGPCARGCSTGSYFSSHSSTLPAAEATGNMTLRPNSLVHSVIYDEETDRATGVRVIDTETKEMHEVYARVVFLCASTLASTQILLNTRTPRFPDGLGNASGELGHNLMDHHFRVGASGELGELEDRYYQGNRPNALYIPRYRNLGDAATRRDDFVRGYGFQGGASRSNWSRGLAQAGFGADFKNALRDAGPWGFGMTAFGECLPRHENYIELAEETDAFGLPQIRIHCTWGENEFAMRADARETAGEMLEAAGFSNVQTYDRYADGELGAEPGLGIHEMGTARMGRDPQTSVLNGNNQLHDVPNVFVTDGACMTSSACQNPSITYMALTARAVHFAVEQMQQGAL